MIVHLDDVCVFETPSARNGVGRYAGEPEARQGLHLVSAGEAARRIMPRLVLDDPRHLGAAVEIHPPGHDGIDRTRHVPHVVASDLARGVGEPVRELRRLRIEQEPWGLDRIAGNADDARLLLLQGSGLVGVHDAVTLPVLSWLILTTMLSGRISKRPVLSAFGISV